MLRAVSFLRAVGLRIFSVVIWTAGFAWMLVGATITLLLLVVGFPYQKVHVWVTAPLFTQVLRIATARVHIHYHPAFDHERRSVFTLNHTNLIDGHLASLAIPHAFSGLMNAWQFHIPIYGWLMRMSKGIGVHKGRRETMLREISEAARERKRIGMSVLTFPEGHRTIDGKIRPFRRGVFLMARNAEMPVVPMVARGMYQMNHKGTFLFQPLCRIDVYVGPQHETEGMDDAAVAELASRLHASSSWVLENGRWPDAWEEPNRPRTTSAAHTPPT
jgi:1-acyl-sn-glycerol-3-phosphate acyltransferase